MQILLDEGISSRRGIMTSHRETAYLQEYSGCKLPVSEDAADNSIIIPLYVPMEDKDVEHVVGVLRKVLAQN